MAKLGIGILIIPQKPWETVDAELARLPRASTSEVNGATAPPPIVAGWVFCDEDDGPRRELAAR